MKLAETKRNARSKLDAMAVALLLVQEVQLFLPDRLQPPERHFPNYTGYIPNEPPPTCPVVHSGRHGVAVCLAGVADQVDDCGLLTPG